MFVQESLGISCVAAALALSAWKFQRRDDLHEVPVQLLAADSERRPLIKQCERALVTAVGNGGRRLWTRRSEV